MAKLFYVIGASGAGKDSILRYSRQRIEELDKCVFAHRYITRHSGAGGENHIELSLKEFSYRSCSGFFCMEWGSHGLRYGIGREVRFWLEQGSSVVVNGSRAYLEQARLDFPEIVPVLIQVSPETLRERLLARKRESVEEIDKRISRSRELSFSDSDLHQIDNDGELCEAGDRFLRLVRSASETQSQLASGTSA